MIKKNNGASKLKAGPDADRVKKIKAVSIWPECIVVGHSIVLAIIVEIIEFISQARGQGSCLAYCYTYTERRVEYHAMIEFNMLFY